MRKILSLLILSFVFLASCELNKQDYFICMKCTSHTPKKTILLDGRIIEYWIDVNLNEEISFWYFFLPSEKQTDVTCRSYPDLLKISLNESEKTIKVIPCEIGNYNFDIFAPKLNSHASIEIRVH